MTPRQPGTRADVLFVLPHLGPGGAQRVVSIVAEHLAKDGCTVAILTLLSRQATIDLPDGVLSVQPPRMGRGVRRVVVIARRLRGVIARLLPDEIRRSLGARRAAFRADARNGASPASQLSAMLPWTDKMRVRFIARTVQRLKPTVVMSLLTKTNVLTLLATAGTETRVVISERNRLARPEPAAIRHLRAALYPACPLVTANASSVVEELKKDLGVAHARLLPNVIRLPQVSLRTRRDNVVSVVARLVPQKRVELAIEAFAALGELDRTWRLQLVGDGPESERLQRLARDVLTPDSYTFFGHLDNPEEALERSRIIVLPSAIEGTSNALLEAMVRGVVPLVSDVADPLGDLVVEGVTGRRFGAGTASIVAQLIRLANQDDLSLMAKQAREVAEQYTWDHQQDAWESVLFGR